MQNVVCNNVISVNNIDVFLPLTQSKAWLKRDENGCVRRIFDPLELDRSEIPYGRSLVHCSPFVTPIRDPDAFLNRTQGGRFPRFPPNPEWRF